LQLLKFEIESFTASAMVHRESLAGCWILDKARSVDWSMTPYLQVMEVDPMAIAAHEKGDEQADTIHTIEFDRRNSLVTLIKRSRVNNDLTVRLQLWGAESVEYLEPEQRRKVQSARSNHPGHLEIRSSLATLSNGVALVTDVKELVQETATAAADGKTETSSVMLQKLTITNQQTKKTHTVTRHFVPYLETPPHLVAGPDEDSSPFK
jgi:hypothetical protein